jgi:hypothetical protein
MNPIHDLSEFRSDADFLAFLSDHFAKNGFHPDVRNGDPWTARTLIPALFGFPDRPDTWLVIDAWCEGRITFDDLENALVYHDFAPVLRALDLPPGILNGSALRTRYAREPKSLKCSLLVIEGRDETHADQFSGLLRLRDVTVHRLTDPNPISLMVKVEVAAPDFYYLAESTDRATQELVEIAAHSGLKESPLRGPVQVASKKLVALRQRELNRAPSHSERRKPRCS